MPLKPKKETNKLRLGKLKIKKNLLVVEQNKETAEVILEVGDK
jgi:hypothetical protein